MTAYERILDALRKHGSRVTTRGNTQASALCPAHQDRQPSLSVTYRQGRVLLHCHAGCETDAILSALGRSAADLFDDKPAKRNGRREVAAYDYVDESRRLLFQAVRYEPKQFKQRRPDGNGGWIWNLDGTRRVLYRLPQVLDAIRVDQTVFVVEGEKDVHAAERAGAVATTCPMGAGSWRSEYGDMLKGADVIIVADRDNDGAGRKHADDVAADLAGKAASVMVMEPVAGKDLADHLAAGHDLGELVFISPSDNTATPQHPRSSDVPTLAVLRRILDHVGDEVRARGLVGEERLAKTLYLVLTSRLLDKQVSAGVKGHSASGKSYTVATVARLFPREAYLEFTAMSERALVYSPEEYKHRTLIVYEVVALREGVEDDMTAYFVRSLLSEGRINYPVTVREKDGGGFTTKTITKEGPTNLIFTTTKTRVHAENETRILSLGTDDSREQTERVILELADERAALPDLADWHDLQRWLANGEHRVTIPYARPLAKLIPPIAVRLRRDVGSLLALIRAHAVLHQASRRRDEQGRIIADLDDYAVVRDLVADTLAEGVGATVSATVRETVAAVETMAKTRPDGVQLQPLADKLNLDKSNVSRRLRQAADSGYVRNLEDKRGKPGRWVVGDPLPESADLLPDPAQLRITEQQPDLDRCGIAVISDGKKAEGG
jgi:Toprim domain